MQVWLQLHRNTEGTVEGSVRIADRAETATFAGWLELLRLLEPDGDTDTTDGSSTQRRAMP